MLWGAAVRSLVTFPGAGVVGVRWPCAGGRVEVFLHEVPRVLLQVGGSDVFHGLVPHHGLQGADGTVGAGADGRDLQRLCGRCMKRSANSKQTTEDIQPRRCVIRLLTGHLGISQVCTGPAEIEDL